jgi:hypothetical protein
MPTLSSRLRNWIEPDPWDDAPIRGPARIDEVDPRDSIPWVHDNAIDPAARDAARTQGEPDLAAAAAAAPLKGADTAVAAVQELREAGPAAVRDTEAQVQDDLALGKQDIRSILNGEMGRLEAEFTASDNRYSPELHDRIADVAELADAAAEQGTLDPAAHDQIGTALEGMLGMLGRKEQGGLGGAMPYLAAGGVGVSLAALAAMGLSAKPPSQEELRTQQQAALMP